MEAMKNMKSYLRGIADAMLALNESYGPCESGKDLININDYTIHNWYDIKERVSEIFR